MNVINLNYSSQIRTFMGVDWGVGDDDTDVTYTTESNQGFAFRTFRIGLTATTITTIIT